jgi:hypothetical protein
VYKRARGRDGVMFHPPMLFDFVNPTNVVDLIWEFPRENERVTMEV